MNTIHLRALSSSQVTVLSNIFIDQYMPGAGGEFVKVYIYLLRLLADPSASVCLPLLADRLNCTEGDISRALKYWSNEGLLILETDPSGELTGITLTEPSPDTQMELTGYPSLFHSLHWQPLLLFRRRYLQPLFPRHSRILHRPDLPLLSPQPESRSLRRTRM